MLRQVGHLAQIYAKSITEVMATMNDIIYVGVFCISPEGEGISEGDLPKLFEPFHTTKRDKKGTGLGLSISKKIVDNHGGNLVIDSELGKGTTARVTLPLAQGV